MTFYVQPEQRASVMETMKDLLYIPFEFENGEASVIYYGPESYTPEENKV